MTDGRKITWLWIGIGVALLLVWSIAQFMQRWQRNNTQVTFPAEVPASPSASSVPSNSPVAKPSGEGSLATPAATLSAPSDFAEPEDNSQPITPYSGNDLKLIIPVAGIKANQLRDTYSDARSEGRTHNAIDIMAPRDAPVLAAADGEIVRLFTSDKGGITLYQLSRDKKFVFYYAHLSRYLDGLATGRFAKQGETIAYVGDTGNATPGNYHLHFAVWQVEDPNRFWNGVNLNPYSLLKQAK